MQKPAVKSSSAAAGEDQEDGAAGFCRDVAVLY